MLVTTRNEGIATAHVHEMKLLPPEDGWSLLCKKATMNAEEEQQAAAVRLRFSQNISAISVVHTNSNIFQIFQMFN